jgi:hypothetical protein
MWRLVTSLKHNKKEGNNMYKNNIIVKRDEDFPSFIDLTNTSSIYLEIVFDNKEMEHFFVGPGETWNIDCGEREVADEILERRNFKVREVSELRTRILQLLDNAKWYVSSDGFGGFTLRRVTPSFHPFEFRWPIEDEDSLQKLIGIVEHYSCPHNAKKGIRRDYGKITEEQLEEDAESMAKECITLLSLLDNLQELKVGA